MKRKFDGIDYEFNPKETYKIEGKFIIELIEAIIDKNREFERLKKQIEKLQKAKEKYDEDLEIDSYIYGG
jgi:hypothetical protein